MNAIARESYCSANDILELNNTKEYTLTSSFILEKILTETSLNANAVKLWQLLFNRARFNPNLETKISVRTLAELLNKSIRTIFRYLNQLLNTGYLNIDNNYRDNGGQRANTFYVRAPQDLIQQAKQTKNRTVIKSYPTEKNNNESNTNNESINSYKIEEINVKNVMEGHDIDDIPNNTNYIINNINNSVVDLKNNNNFEDPQNIQNEINKKELHLAQLTLQSQELEKEWLAAKEFTDKIKLNTQFRIAASAAEVIAMQIIDLKHQIQNTITQQIRKDQLFKDPFYVNNLKGERQLPSFTYKRLQLAIEQFSLPTCNKIKLMNEIVHEVRFGGLVLNNKTNTVNSIERSVNIAIKLLRESRWTEPTDFNNNIYGLVLSQNLS